MNWLYYLLEANLYLMLFYGFYRLFLQNETFYNLNRYFLLLSTLLSFALPVLQLGFLKPSNYQIQGDIMYEIPPPPTEPPSVVSVSNPFADVNWFYIFYLLIAFGFALKLGFSIYKIIKIWLKAKKHIAGDITLVEVNDESTAFSFFNLLFIHPQLANQAAVIKHEMVHIKQKHSFDVLFFELIQIICWFNPILHFIKKDIKLLHEYIADELTTNADMQKHEYALFLIQNSFGLRAQAITNQIFNQSILKRRINMLNKKRTAGWARLRLLLALPLTGAMLCTSTMAFTKDYGYVDLLPEKSESASPMQEKPKVANIKKSSTPKVQNVKRDEVKSPPPIAKQDKDRFTPRIEVRESTQKPVNTDNRYIIINGKPLGNKFTFYGVTNTKDVIYLNSKTAVKKYGEVAKFGAVEIIGDNIKYVTETPFIVPPPPVEPPPPGYKPKKGNFPPPPKRDQIKFPPTFKPKQQNSFYEEFRFNKQTATLERANKRYIVVNGNPFEDQEKFYGATHTESVTILNVEEATKRYGNKGSKGAIEITGSSITFLDQLPVPPPPVEPLRPKQKTKKTAVPSTPKPSPKRDVVNLKKVTKYLEGEIKKMAKDDERLIPVQKMLLELQLGIMAAKNNKN